MGIIFVSDILRGQFLLLCVNGGRRGVSVLMDATFVANGDGDVGIQVDADNSG